MLETVYWLNSVAGLGPAKIKKIAPDIDTARCLWSASYEELTKKFKIDVKMAREMIHCRNSDKIQKDIAGIRKQGVEIISYLDERYPRQLLEIHDPPILLFAKGDTKLLLSDMEKYIGIVGTRKPTPYGLKMTGKIVGELAGNDMVIVSGMAKGIDAAAHKAALEANGKTIAVLGCGCDVIYPKINAYIYEGIISKGGLILSELPPGTTPLKHHFPKRNRMISGLCSGILVIEAGMKSGSLITARYGSDQGRTIMALPGNVTNPMAMGCLEVLKMGGVPIASGSDVLKELQVTMKAGHTAPDLVQTSLEKSLALIEPATADQISALLKADVYDIMMQLTLLEVKGRIKRLPGGLYVCA